MRISDWSSDVCSSDLTDYCGAVWIPEKEAMNSTKNMSYVNSASPMVSVGIPTFNRPVSLNKTLDNIRKQSYKNLEIIVSDNSSDDLRVGKIIKEKDRKSTRLNSSH